MFKPSPLRLLPSAIGAMALLTAVKATALIQNVPPAAEMSAGLLSALGSAATARPAVVTEVRAEEPIGSSAPGAAATPLRLAPGGAAPTAALTPPEMPPTAAELSIAEDLRARRLALAEAERALAAREALLLAAERRLGVRAEELAALRAELEAQAKAATERDEAAWRGLVRVYEAMRPRDAAAIFDELDMAVLAEVVGRMREVRAAPVLAGMQHEKARALTQELARRRTALRSAGR